MQKEYVTIVWKKEKDGSRSSDQKYRGLSLVFALTLAGHLFSLKLLEIECVKTGELTFRYNLEPNHEYIDNVEDFYITVSEAPTLTETEELFSPLYEFGDRSVGTFTRFSRH